MVQTPPDSPRISLASRWKAMIASFMLAGALLPGCASGPIWQLDQFRSAWQAGDLKDISGASVRPVVLPAEASNAYFPVRKMGLRAAHAEQVVADDVFLTAEQVRCQAAAAAVLGELTEIERGLAAEFYGGNPCVPANMKALQQELLVLRTAKHGNDAAAGALEAFYQLAEAQRQQVLLENSRDEIAAMLANYQELKNSQLNVDLEPGVLDRQKLANEEQRQVLDAGLAQGWAKLEVLLGANGSFAEVPRFQSETGQPPPPPDRGEAVQTAIEMRPELKTLRTVICRIRPATLPLARAVLQQYDGALGTVEPAGVVVKVHQVLSSLLFWGADKCPLPSQVREVEVRRMQLMKLLAQREAAVAAEVDAALIAWRKAAREWELADQRVASWREQLDRLKQRQPVEETITAFDLSRARLGRLEAESDRLKAAFAWRQAEVQLWTAQGTVGAGCGLPGHEGFWCESCQEMHGERPVQTPAEPPPQLLEPPTAPEPVVTPASAALPSVRRRAVAIPCREPVWAARQK